MESHAEALRSNPPDKFDFVAWPFPAVETSATIIETHSTPASSDALVNSAWNGSGDDSGPQYQWLTGYRHRIAL